MPLLLMVIDLKPITILIASKAYSIFITKVDLVHLFTAFHVILRKWLLHGIDAIMPHLQAVYIVCIVTLGSITATVTLMKHFRTPAYRWVRTSLFLSWFVWADSYVSPNFCLRCKLDTSYKAMALSNMKLMAGSYIIGALIYGCRIPERILPGRFNYFGASHQIFHFCVVIALFSHYLGVLNAMTFWHDPENKHFVLHRFKYVNHTKKRHNNNSNKRQHYE
ncbi:hypothetical protein K501DRAFT_268771 [Backusella circina FSU 941]|nr:hypothetical protein K501DRAFT_268771 [Backusella circina FSU 941]